MKMSFSFLLLFSVFLMNLKASETKLPNIGTYFKEIETFEKELEYIKNLKNQYLKKEEILTNLTQESKQLLAAQRKYIKKKRAYTFNIKKLQHKKRKNQKTKKSHKKTKQLRKNDFIVSLYVSKVRSLLQRNKAAFLCKEKELNKLSESHNEAVTSSIITIDSSGRLIGVKFISPRGHNGFHHQGFLRCLSKEISNLNFPHSPTQNSITILQPFYFSS